MISTIALSCVKLTEGSDEFMWTEKVSKFSTTSSMMIEIFLHSIRVVTLSGTKMNILGKFEAS